MILDQGQAPGASSAAGEVVQQRTGVVVLPALVGAVLGVLLVQAPQQVGQLAADDRPPEQPRQLGQGDQPLRIPGCPVIVGSVGDAEDLMVGLARLVEQVADPGAALLHLMPPRMLSADGIGDRSDSACTWCCVGCGAMTLPQPPGH